jgi:hypothetical protein
MGLLCISGAALPEWRCPVRFAEQTEFCIQDQPVLRIVSNYQLALGDERGTELS